MQGEFYECIAIPFGWNLAPYTFTKFTRPVITALRAPSATIDLGYVGKLGHLRAVIHNYHVQIYIDDILTLSADARTQTAAADAMFQLFTDLGILCHPGKCELTPQPCLDFLGMRIDIPK